MEIPWPLLRLWVDLLDSNPVELSYTDLLNASAVDGLFTIRRGCLRIEELLRKKAGTVRQAKRKTQGSKRQQLDTNVYKLSVRRMETESLETLKAEVEKCEKDLGQWKKKYADLENEKQNLYNEMKNEINKLEEEISELHHVNKELAECVEALEEKESFKCQGKKLIK